MLDHQRAVAFLLRRHLISEASIVAGDLIICEGLRRNRSFMVMCEHAPSYMLKQGTGPDGSGTMAHEAAVYHRLQASCLEHGLDRYLPHCYGYEPDEDVLILELVRDAQNLREYFGHTGRFPTRPARQLGHALGTLHASMRCETPDPGGAGAGMLPSADSPWVFRLHRPHLGLFREFSGANIQLIMLLQRSPELCQRLEELSARWQAPTWIHRDVKWDNCLVFPLTAGRKPLKLKLVDWEMAQPGDPCWDVGAVFAEFLNCWLCSIPMTGEAPPARLLEFAGYPLERMHPAIRAFWQAYVNRMGLDATAASESALRAVAYAAARLIQTHIEQLQLAARLTSTTAALLQLSLNMLRRPAEATMHLLGLALQPMRNA